MPANLTIQYRKAEEAFRRATTPAEELDALQYMLREVPKHKGTDKLQADLKQKIRRARESLVKQPAGGRRESFRIPRQGAGRAVLIGAPNSGKSSLLERLTNASPEIAPYPFTTHKPQPGMMPFEDVAVQLIDTAPITADSMEPATQELIRSADLVLFLVDLMDDDGPENAMAAIKSIQSTKTRLGNVTQLDPRDVGVSHTKTFVLLHKFDAQDAAFRRQFYDELEPPQLTELTTSLYLDETMDSLKAEVFAALDVVRVYTKSPQSKQPDYAQPFTIPRGGTLLDVAELIHRDLAQNFKSARVWGAEVHDGTMVKADYEPRDRDVIEIHRS